MFLIRILSFVNSAEGDSRVEEDSRATAEKERTAAEKDETAAEAAEQEEVTMRVEGHSNPKWSSI